MFLPAVIQKLQETRRATYPHYDTVTLDKKAVSVLARYFANPDCQTDIDLAALDEPRTTLSFLGDHIITAAPSTLAQYAEKHNKKIITGEDIVLCFALDHAHDIHDNHMAEEKNTLYALAHIALPSCVTGLRRYTDALLATLEYTTPWGSITFDAVVVPDSVTVNVGDFVFQHFGVIAARADTVQFGHTVMARQNADPFISALARDAARKQIIIDFSNPALFHKDVTGRILKPKTVRTIQNPGDIANGKIVFKH